MTTPQATTRHVLQSLLAGGAPNGVPPTECGEWGGLIQDCYAQYDQGGTEAVRRFVGIMMRSKDGKGLTRLLQESDQKQPGGWSAIIPFHTFNLPSFPTEVFPDWLRAFVEAEAEATQTPTDLAGMLALSVLSTACARYVAVQPKAGWIEPVNIFTMTALPPASRKSPVFAAMVAPLVEEERRLSHESAVEIKQAQARQEVAEGRLNQAKSKAAKLTNQNDILAAMEEVDQLAEELAQLTVPAPPRLIVDDISTEQLATMIYEQGGRIAALSPEGDIFNIMGGRYSANSTPNFGVYLKAHAGDDLRVDRKGRPAEFVERPALTLGLTVQPDVLRSLSDRDVFRGLGLLGRFLYARPKSLIGARRSNVPPVPPAVQQAYHSAVTYLLRLVPNLGSVNSANSANYAIGSHFSNIYLLSFQEATTLRLLAFQDWLEPKLAEGEEFSAFTDWAGKLHGTVARLAALLHMADYASSYSHNSHNSHNISLSTFERAITLVEYLIPHAKAAFAEIGADPSVNAARYVLAWLQKRRMSTFTKRDAFEGTKGRFKRASDLDPVLELLADHGYVRPVDADDRFGPGRKPSPSFEVHPTVWAF